WFNAHYLRLKSEEELAKLYLPILEAKGIRADPATVARVCGLIKERATFVSDFWDLSAYFFEAPETYDRKAAEKFWKPENKERIVALRDVLANIENFSVENAEKTVHDWIVAREYPMGQVMNAFRLALVGVGMGPSMFEICAVIGRTETLRRIDRALQRL
ncbi:MAG: glutamate--tRNA ligase, partial [Rikenellaceae bacterium]|nr:glutamate--tRNA ligase [Rikenellaceae bacterium]